MYAVFISYLLHIVQAYFTFTLTPVLQKDEKQNTNFHEIGGYPKQPFAKFRFSHSKTKFRLSALMYVLKHLSNEEENELKFPLALYIRLDFKS